MIIFKTKHHADVEMFDAPALSLIKSMGRSDSIPGALNPDEVEQALQSLKTALNKASARNSSAGDCWDDDSVSLSHRGAPLVELLENALKEEEHVIWEKSLI